MTTPQVSRVISGLRELVPVLEKYGNCVHTELNMMEPFVREKKCGNSGEKRIVACFAGHVFMAVHGGELETDADGFVCASASKERVRFPQGIEIFVNALGFSDRGAFGEWLSLTVQEHWGNRMGYALFSSPGAWVDESDQPEKENRELNFSSQIEHLQRFQRRLGARREDET